VQKPIKQSICRLGCGLVGARGTMHLAWLGILPTRRDTLGVIVGHGQAAGTLQAYCHTYVIRTGQQRYLCVLTYLTLVFIDWSNDSCWVRYSCCCNRFRNACRTATLAPCIEATASPCIQHLSKARNP